MRLYSHSILSQDDVSYSVMLTIEVDELYPMPSTVLIVKMLHHR